MSELDESKVLRLWLPLAVTWAMMAIEGPVLTSIIARLAEPKFNLAAFGVSWALALIVESPIIMILSATTALCDSRRSYYKIRNFIFVLNVLTTVGMLVLQIPEVFQFISTRFFSLVPEVSSLVMKALLYMIPWPAAIGYRRFYQGIMIREKNTGRVAFGTVTRVASMGLTAILLYSLGALDGASLATCSLAIGVIIEALVTRIIARGSVANVLKLDGPMDELTYARLSGFYFPLFLTTLLGLVSQPLLISIVSHSRQPIESLAILPIVNGLNWFLMSLSLGMQETSIVLAGPRWEGFNSLRNFSLKLAVLLSLISGIFIFTPLSSLWFLWVTGLSPDLSLFARNVIKFHLLTPGIYVFSCMFKGMFISKGRSRLITVTTVLELVSMVVTLYLLVFVFDFVGAYGAVISSSMGIFAAVLFLTFQAKIERRGGY